MLYNSLQHALSLLSLLYFHQVLLGNGFQRHSFLNFCVHVLTGWRMSHNWLNSRSVLLITPWHRPHRKHHFQQFYCYVMQLSHGPHREDLFPVSLLVCVRNMLPSNGHCLQSHYLATGLHATV
jgi:hypothetical protein